MQKERSDKLVDRLVCLINSISSINNPYLKHEEGPSEPSGENFPALQSKHGPELLYFPVEHDKLQVLMKEVVGKS